MDESYSTALLEVFKRLPDPRQRMGRRHHWETLLTLMAAALASACRTPRAIARWVHEQRTELLAALPPHVSRLPSEATLRRAMATIDVVALERELNRLPAAPPPAPCASNAPRALVGLAIDGKALRGVSRDGHPCQLVSVVQHGNGHVLGQVAVARKRDERSAVPPLLAGRDLTGTVVTLDALHTLRSTARLIRAQGGHYLMIVKKNQAVLYEYLDLLFSLPAHPADHEVWDHDGPHSTKEHGRLETRRLSCGNAHIEDLDWPGVQQVVRRECERRILRTGKTTRAVSYGVVSMTPEEAGAATIEALWRGHWTIENRVHYVRDVSFGEDAGHAAQGRTAQCLAALRNAILRLFRQAHWRYVPDAFAHYAASVLRALALIGLKVKT